MTSRQTKVICCGHAAYDLNFMMAGYPSEDQKYRIDELLETGGGPAANAASLLTRWGAGTAFAGLIGDDTYGRIIKAELEDDGVDTSLVQMDASRKTPLSAVIVNTDTGSRTILNRRDPADQPSAGGETAALLKGFSPEVLHFDGHALDLSLKMMEAFPEAKTVMDAGSYREASDRLCRSVDFVLCSRRFAEECTGISDITSPDGRQQCLEFLSKRYGGQIVVTLGSAGLFYSSIGSGSIGSGDNSGGGNALGGKPVAALEAFKADAVDSTGAGDIFHGAFSYGLLSGFPLETNLKFSSAAAAISVTRAGGKTSIPGLNETLKLAGIPRI